MSGKRKLDRQRRNLMQVSKNPTRLRMSRSLSWKVGAQAVLSNLRDRELCNQSTARTKRRKNASGPRLVLRPAR